MTGKRIHINTIGKDVRGRAWELYKENFLTFVALAIVMLFCEAIVWLLTVIHPAFGILSALLACVYAYCNVLLAVMIHSGKGKVTLTDVFVEFSVNEFLSFLFVIFVKFVILAAVGVCSMILYAGYAIFAHLEAIKGFLDTAEVLNVGTYISALLMPLTLSNTTYGVFLLNVFIAAILFVAFNYRYALVEYIAADLVGESPSLCLDQSKKLMKGYRIKMYGNDVILAFGYIGISLLVSIISTVIIGVVIGPEVTALFSSFANDPTLMMNPFIAVAQLIELVLSNPVVIIVGILSTLLGVAVSFTFANLVNLTHSEFYFTLQDVEDNVYVPYVPAKKKKKMNKEEVKEVEDKEVQEEVVELNDELPNEFVDDSPVEEFDIPSHDMSYNSVEQNDPQDEMFEIE